jgi:hypothetical protein
MHPKLTKKEIKIIQKSEKSNSKKTTSTKQFAANTLTTKTA